MNTTGWLKGPRVTADGTEVVSHAGVALIRALADNTGLIAGLSKALASAGCWSMTGPGTGSPRPNLCVAVDAGPEMDAAYHEGSSTSWECTTEYQSAASSRIDRLMASAACWMPSRFRALSSRSSARSSEVANSRDRSACLV